MSQCSSIKVLFNCDKNAVLPTLAFYGYDYSVRQLITSPGIYIEPPGLLQRSIARLAWQAGETPAVGTECCRTADSRCTTARPHHIDTATAPLATSTMMCRLQDRRPGFPVLDWSGTLLPSRGLSAWRRHQRSPTLISRHSDLCHVPHVQHLRWPMLRSCRSTAMELTANQSKTVSHLKRLLKTFLFSAWGHGTLWHLPKSVPYIYPLTYLHATDDAL